jgi:hypothetical protein
MLVALDPVQEEELLHVINTNLEPDAFPRVGSSNDPAEMEGKMLWRDLTAAVRSLRPFVKLHEEGLVICHMSFRNWLLDKKKNPE